MFVATKRRVFVGTPIIKPPSQFVLFPPNCISVSNVVSKTTFNMSVCGTQIVEKYPFCRRNSKNWRAVLIRSINPPGAASVYDDGMMMITGCTSKRASRWAADRYVDYLRAAGYPKLDIVKFAVVNNTTTFGMSNTLDVERYRRDACPELVYIPDSFVGARKKGRRTGALITLFTNYGTALGSPDLHNLCLDVEEELLKLRPFLVERNSPEEAAVLARAAVSRKRTRAPVARAIVDDSIR